MVLFLQCFTHPHCLRLLNLGALELTQVPIPAPCSEISKRCIMIKPPFRKISILCFASFFPAIAAGFSTAYFSGNGMSVPISGLWVGILITFALVLLVSLPLFLLAVQRAVSSARRVSRGAEAVSEGDFSVQFSTGGTDCLASMEKSLDDLIRILTTRLSFAEGVVKGIDTPFVVVDTEEKLICTNPSLLNIIQQDGKPEDYYGQNVAYFFYGDASRRTVLADSLEQHTVTKREVILTGRKGGKRTIFIHASPLFDLMGKLMGALCIYQDLTELREREQEILQKNAIIAEAIEGSETISRQVADIAATVSGQIQASNDAAAVQTTRALDTSSAMEQMNIAVNEVARNAAGAAEQAEAANLKAQKGSQVVEDALQAITSVAEISSRVHEDVVRLGREADEIGKVVDVITDIADQTNLLALNAAIEAARAGDAGRGFAVVADEVRKLAEKTMNATREVGEAIAAIQEGTRRNVANVSDVAEEVARSRSLSGASGEVLREIVQLVAVSKDQVQEIAAAADQQSVTCEHINRAIEEVKEVSLSASEDISQASEGVRRLAAMTAELKQVIQGIESQQPG